jgi:hypothetical protein
LARRTLSAPCKCWRARSLETKGAADGLKRAVLDEMTEKITSMVEAGATRTDALSPGRAQEFIRAKREVMRAAGFSDEQLGALDGIAADIKRQQRFYATKAAGQSNTPQDLFKILKKQADKGHDIGPIGQGYVAFKEGGWKGLGAYVGYEVTNHMRNAGLKKVEAIMKDAVLHPDRAEALLICKAAPRVTNKGWQKRLSNSFQRSAMYGGLAAQRHEALGPPGNDIYVNRGATAGSP